METEKLVIKGAELKAQVAAATAELREINNQLAGLATFKDGNKTGDIVAGGYRVKVTMRDNIKYDQTRLGVIQGHFDNFNNLFSIQYKPDKRKLDAAVEINEELAKAVDWARTVTPGAPNVVYEALEKEVPAC